MRKLIAPTDFSPIAEDACIYAAKLAMEIKAELVLFHTIELPVAIAEYPVTDELFDDTEVEKKLDDLKNKLSDVTSHQVKIYTGNVLGFTGNAIIELCDRIKPFAVVMSSYHSSSFRRIFPASTTVAVAKHLHFPVIVVPVHGVFKAYKKIAFACDLKNIDAIPVVEIELIVKLFNAILAIFYVGKNENEINEDAINDLLLHHRMGHLNVQHFYVENKDVWTGISRLADEQQIDMLIILSKKHGLFHRSATKEFIINSDIPVMVTHEKNIASK